MTCWPAARKFRSRRRTTARSWTFESAERPRLSADCGLDRFERGAGLRSIRAASLRHIGPAAAAFAAQHLGGFADQLDGVEASDQIVGDADHDAGSPVIGNADNRHDAGTDLFLALVGEAA